MQKDVIFICIVIVACLSLLLWDTSISETFAQNKNHRSTSIHMQKDVIFICIVVVVTLILLPRITESFKDYAYSQRASSRDSSSVNDASFKDMYRISKVHVPLSVALEAYNMRQKVIGIVKDVTLPEDDAYSAIYRVARPDQQDAVAAFDAWITSSSMKNSVLVTDLDEARRRIMQT